MLLQLQHAQHPKGVGQPDFRLQIAVRKSNPSHSPNLQAGGPTQVYQVLIHAPAASDSTSAASTLSPTSRSLSFPMSSPQKVAQQLVQFADHPVAAPVPIRTARRNITAAALQQSNAEERKHDHDADHEPSGSDGEAMTDCSEAEQDDTGSARRFTMEEKHRAIIMHYDKNIQRAEIMRQLKVSRRSLTRWLGKERDSIQAYVRTLSESAKKQRKNIAHQLLDPVLTFSMAGYVAAASDEHMVDVPFMQSMCEEFRDIVIPIFERVQHPRIQALLRSLKQIQFSTTWCRQTLFNHHLRYSNLDGEGGEVDLSVAQSAQSAIAALLSRWPVQLIYNCDETALFWLLEAGKQVHRANVNRGKKRNKTRVSILLACNAAGTDQVKPLVINKSWRPRCLKNVHLKVEWAANTKAWMTSEIFSTWLHSFDAHIRDRHGPNARAVVCMDGVSSHHAIFEIVLPNTTCFLLPPNTTSRLQPLDQGIIRSFKCRYHRAAQRIKARSFMRQRFNITSSVAPTSSASSSSSVVAATSLTEPQIIDDEAEEEGESQDGSSDDEQEATEAAPCVSAAAMSSSALSSSSSSSPAARSQSKGSRAQKKREKALFDLKDMTEQVFQQWHSLPAAIVQNCWKKSGLLAPVHLEQLKEVNARHDIDELPMGEEVVSDADYNAVVPAEDAEAEKQERLEQTIIDIATVLDDYVSAYDDDVDQ